MTWANKTTWSNTKQQFCSAETKPVEPTAHSKVGWWQHGHCTKKNTKEILCYKRSPLAWCPTKRSTSSRKTVAPLQTVALNNLSAMDPAEDGEALSPWGSLQTLGSDVLVFICRSILVAQVFSASGSFEALDKQAERWILCNNSQSHSNIIQYPLVNSHSYWKWPIYSWFTH